MARIVSFTELGTLEHIRPHTEVECGYRVVATETGTMLQLDTYGSGERQIPGKVSQSLQLDENLAHQLMKILRQTFPSLA